MYHFSQVSNGEHSSVANVGGLETDSFNFQQHVFDAQFSCLKFDSQNLLCQSSGDNSAPILFGSVVDSFLSSDEDTFCDTYSEYSELPCHEVSLYEHFRHENNILESNYSAPVNEVEVVCATSGMVPTRKNRIKWTKDLHEQFVVAVNSLGGPQSKLS
ncbi:hypothetical protein glysoja_049940 [Glycine soja]|uniref:Uncharacterized protein n=1 Tax=Glycine soja TaxID=3848 RepID=A0A0B2PUX2_GLYSO|nr:hypothetical protein glysoja_049940 [Glycine soja]